MVIMLILFLFVSNISAQTMFRRTRFLNAAIEASYDMEATSGNAIDDFDDNDLTDNNTVGTGTGHIGNARDFEDTNSEFFSRADDVDLSFSDESFAISLWYNVESVVGNVGFVHKLDGTEDEWNLFLNDDVPSVGQDRFDWFVRDVSTWYSVRANNIGTPSTGTWSYLLAWYDFEQQKLFIQGNNGAIDSTTSVPGVNDDTGVFRLGDDENIGTGNYMDGLMDAVHILRINMSNRAYRKMLYNNGHGREYPF